MSDADYELWAAMMADEEEKSPVAPVAVVANPVASSPEVVEPPKIFPLTPVTQPEPVVEEVETAVEVDVEPDEEEEVEFSTNLFKEPQTNSITVQEVPDALTSEIVTESGEILKTGAIDMPILSNTGSIPIITVVPEEEDQAAINAAMGDEATGGIPPIRSVSVTNSTAKVGVLPIKNRRSETQTVLLATTSLLLVAIGAGLIAANMLGLI